jgi:hypothetical protein
MFLGEVITIFNTGNVVEILPLLGLNKNGCAPTNRYFEHRIPVSNLNQGRGLEPGRYLIHVRSLNGQAKNFVSNF